MSPVPFADITDLLNLTATSFECIEGDSPDRTGDKAVIKTGAGKFLQADTRMTEKMMTHKYHILEKTATLPVRGKHTGLSSVVYFIDNVKVDNPENGHHSMTVTFSRWEDVDTAVQTVTRSDLGLS